MAWTIFGLVTLVALGRLTDFLLGDPGTRRVKDRLVSFYITIAEGDWSQIFRATSRLYLAYIQRIFGNDVLSFRFFIAVGIYSVPLTSVIFISIFGFEAGFLNNVVRFARASNLLHAFMLSVIVNYAIDLAAIATLIFGLRSLQLWTGFRTLIIFAITAGITYFFVTLAIGISSAAMLVLVNFPGVVAIPCEDINAFFQDPQFQRKLDYQCLANYVLGAFWHPVSKLTFCAVNITTRYTF
jgi:hypothetical protein